MSRSPCGRHSQAAPGKASSRQCDDLNRRRQGLLDEARAGSRDAHGELLNTYVPRMARFFQRQLSPNLAVKTSPHDLAQDACAAALSGFGGFAGSQVAQYAAWLKTICRNLVKKLGRAYAPCGGRDVKRETPLDDLVSQTAGEHDLGRRQLCPDEIAERREARRQLRAALKQLPKDLRWIVAWRHRGGLSLAAIARRLAVSNDRVERAHRRSLARLRRLLFSAAGL